MQRYRRHILTQREAGLLESIREVIGQMIIQEFRQGLPECESRMKYFTTISPPSWNSVALSFLSISALKILNEYKTNAEEPLIHSKQYEDWTLTRLAKWKEQLPSQEQVRQGRKIRPIVDEILDTYLGRSELMKQEGYILQRDPVIRKAIMKDVLGDIPTS